jgi:glycosyltransferase involved in cell wall biosynthesis
MDSLKILMVSTSYPQSTQDWRGRFIADLAAGLGRRPEIELMLWAPPGELPPGVVAATTTEDKAWLRQLSEQGGIAHLLRNDKLQGTGAAIRLLRSLHRTYLRTDADLVHVNWLQNALPLRKMAKPAVVSVLGTDFGLLRLPGMRLALRSAFRRRRTILAPNAQWMEPVLKNAFGDVAEIRTVPFGIDERWFQLQRSPQKDKAHHWLAVTRVTANKIGDLFDWGKRVFGEHRVLHLLGPMQETLTLPDWVKYHGPTHPSELRETWFPMSSGLVTLSRHDEGRPQVMLEAMASALPVVASDLPAHRDIIQHRQTGWIAATPDEFREGLDCLEQDESSHVIGHAARDWVKQEVGTWDDCAARYAHLYTKLLETPQ